MITKEPETTAARDVTMEKAYRPGEPFAIPTDLCMYPGHAFTQDPHGGIFRRGEHYVVEEFEKLKTESRGKHIPTPDEKIEFSIESVAGERTQFIVKP